MLEAPRRRTVPARFTSSTSRHAALTLLAAGVLQLAGCAADVAPDDPVAATVAAVVGGQVASGNDEFSGIVRLWTFNSQFEELRQFCSGVLLRNNIVLTARHCLVFTQEALDYGWTDLSSDVSYTLTVTTQGRSQTAVGVGAPAYAPDGRDIAAFKISGPFTVLSRGELNSTDYFRPPASPRDGQSLVTLGFGATDPAATSSICHYESLNTGRILPGCWDDPVPLSAAFGDALGNGSEILTLGVTGSGGDSGGPTYEVTSLDEPIADLPLAGINSLSNRCLDSGPCGAVSIRIDDIGSWLAAL